MRLLISIVFFLQYFALTTFADDHIEFLDSAIVRSSELINTDSLLDQLLELNQISNDTLIGSSTVELKQLVSDSSDPDAHKVESFFVIPTYIEPIKIDSLILLNNPFFIEMVFMGYSKPFNYDNKPNFKKLYYGDMASNLGDAYIIKQQPLTVEQIIGDLRSNARDEITRTAADVYIMSFDQLPDPNGVKSHIIQSKSIKDLAIVLDTKKSLMPVNKLTVKKELLGPWSCKANSFLQFSQNMSSENWYQGGSSSMSLLGILTAKLNYDNKKSVQWENNAEWRMGMNAVFNDSTVKRAINTNDDVIRINSKLGIRAGDSFFYSSFLDVSTQVLKNYKGINSVVLKSSFLSPVRLNLGVGMDFKYKKLFSLMLSPVSYKYIYVLEKDPKVINPNMFGIKNGETHLSEFGSSFRAQTSFSPLPELQIESRLSFYTNYEKVEIDWEIIGNFTINRFLSTRVSLNPRYDNTVILSGGEKAKIQFKELVSFGFSYKLLN